MNPGGGFEGCHKWAESKAVSEADNPQVSSLGPSVAGPWLSWEQTPVLCKLVSFFPFSVYFCFLVKFISENCNLVSAELRGMEIFLYPSWDLGCLGLPGLRLCWWQLQQSGDP